MNDESERSKPKIGKRKSMILIALLAVFLVAVLIAALVFTSGSNKTDNGTRPDLVSGTASDLIVNQSDMGVNWDTSTIETNTTVIAGDFAGPDMVSAAYTHFDQLNSTGQLEYRVEVGIIVFTTAHNATDYYNETLKMGSDPLTSPVPLGNVSVGDGGIILDGPHMTLGHEAKRLTFTDRNVACVIVYHHASTYETLPNSLLIDLANKQDAKIQ